MQILLMLIFLHAQRLHKKRSEYLKKQLDLGADVSFKQRVTVEKGIDKGKGIWALRGNKLCESK